MKSVTVTLKVQVEGCETITHEEHTVTVEHNSELPACIAQLSAALAIRSGAAYKEYFEEKEIQSVKDFYKQD